MAEKKPKLKPKISPPEDLIPWGIGSLDLKLDGGIYEGVTTQVVGGPDYGKTTSVAHLMGSWMRVRKGGALFVMADHKFDKKWFGRHGVKMSRLSLHPGGKLEDTFDAINHTIDTDLSVNFIAIDSIRAMTTSAMYALEFNAGPGQMAPEAHVTNRFFRNLSERLYQRRVKQSPVTMVVINHESYVPLPGGKSMVVIPYGRQQLYQVHTRVRFEKPEYRDVISGPTGTGDRMPTVVRFKYVVQKQHGSATKGEGWFDCYHAGPRTGQIREALWWFSWGEEIGYITGKGPYQVTAEEEKYRSKADLQDRMLSDADWFAPHKVRMMPQIVRWWKDHIGEPPEDEQGEPRLVVKAKEPEG